MTKRKTSIAPYLAKAAERPASPAARTTEQAFKLTDESRAGRGRVDAVVRWRPPLGQCPPPPRTRHHSTCVSPAGGEATAPSYAELTRGVIATQAALDATAPIFREQGQTIRPDI